MTLRKLGRRMLPVHHLEVSLALLRQVRVKKVTMSARTVGCCLEGLEARRRDRRSFKSRAPRERNELVQ